MAGVLHGSARTTPRVRAELQASKEATRALAAQYKLNPKTVAKWRKRTTTADQPMGPSRPRSTVLTEAEEAIVVEFRRRTLLPLDDVLGCLRESIPTLSRSALHRCLVRHGISRLPKDPESTSKRGRFAETKIGYVHVDHCELCLAEGKLPMFLAIDRVSKFTHVAFFEAATKMNGAAFLRDVLAFVTASNFGKPLKQLRWRTPFQAICEAWAKDPAPFKINPHHLIPGPHTYSCQSNTGR